VTTVKGDLIKLLEELFGIGASYKANELLEIRGKFIDYLATEENLFDLFQNPDNHVLAHDAVKFIDANMTLHRTADPEKAHVFAKPVLDRLFKIKDGSCDATEWTYYDVVMFTGLCISTIDMDQLMELYRSALLTMESLDDHLLTAKLMNNYLLRLLHELSFEFDYYDNDEDKKDQIEFIETAFIKDAQPAITFCKKHGFKDWQYIIQAYVGLFEGNQSAIDESYKQLQTILPDQACEVVAGKIKDYQKTDRYEQKEAEFEHQQEHLFEEVE